METYTGYRVRVATEGGERYGLARVRYANGHQNAGQYEVEFTDGPPLLVPFADVDRGPNADRIPRGVTFPEGELYRPRFLDGTRRAYLSTGPGVIVPGDMDQLRTMIERVQPGDRVEWRSHGSNEFWGIVTVASVDDKGIRVDGPKGAPPRCGWPVEGDEFEVNGRNALHFIRVPPARTGKARSRSLSLTFKRS